MEFFDKKEVMDLINPDAVVGGQRGERMPMIKPMGLEKPQGYNASYTALPEGSVWIKLDTDDLTSV